jgi:uncharacterized protein (TIGR03435 family)
MSKFGEATRGPRELLLLAVGLSAVVVPLIFGAANAAPHLARPQQQSQIQTTAPAAARPVTYEYDVASIKRVNPGRGINIAGRIGTSETTDGLTLRFVTMKILLQMAYAVDNYQLSGTPDWVNSERYDIDAKMDSPAADELQRLGRDERTLVRQQMLQKLLAERFNLTIHREKKELQVYMLVVAKKGPKVPEAKPDDTSSDQPKAGPGFGVLYMWGGHLKGHGVPLATLTSLLTAVLHRPVLDKTGLMGKYDLTLNWAPDENPSQSASGPQGPPGSWPNDPLPPDSNGGPSLFTAIQEQLGLKLESGKGSVEIIVIDHVERPSEN